MIKENRFISNQEIEGKAYALLNRFETMFGKIGLPPIPIDKIIEKYLDLWIDWDIVDDTDEEKILGFIDPVARKIRLNERHRNLFDEYIGTEAYTKAHEVGHWELHVVKNVDAIQPPLLSDPVAQPYLCRQQNFDKREIQAEKFAAYLLMPFPLVMNAIASVELTDWRSLYLLKENFGVTITAMTKRLKGLGLIYIAEDKKIFHSEEEAHGTIKLF